MEYWHVTSVESEEKLTNQWSRKASWKKQLFSFVAAVHWISCSSGQTYSCQALYSHLWWSSFFPNPTFLTPSSFQMYEWSLTAECYKSKDHASPCESLPRPKNFSSHSGIAAMSYWSRHACRARMSCSNHRIMFDFLSSFLCSPHEHGR